MRTIITSKPCIIDLSLINQSGYFIPLVLMPLICIFTLDDCHVWWTKALNILALIITSILSLNSILWRTLGKEILSTDEENLIVTRKVLFLKKSELISGKDIQSISVNNSILDEERIIIQCADFTRKCGLNLTNSELTDVFNEIERLFLTENA